MSDAKSQVMTITPEVAALWLSTKNKTNRPFSEATIQRYMQELREGKWMLNGQTIIFGKSGNLLNGQHRLRACSITGISFETFVVYGIDDGAFSTIDDGAQRTYANVLGIRREANATTVAAATRFLWMYATGQLVSDGHKKGQARIGTKSVLDETLKQHPGLRQSAKLYHVLRSREGGMLLPSSLAVGLHYLFSLVDQIKADQFFTSLQSGFGLSAGHPVGMLRARLIAGKSPSANLTKEAIYFYTVTAWNHYLRGKPLKRVAFAGGDRVPEIQGLPKSLMKELLPRKQEMEDEPTNVSTDRRTLLSAAR